MAPSGIVDPSGTIDFEFGRQFLPYAKTSGWTKYRKRATFHRPNPAPIHEISDLNAENSASEPIPFDLEYATVDGLSLVGDEVRLTVIPDGRLGIRLDAYITDQSNNPAFVWPATVTAPTGQIVQFTEYTSHSGQISYEYFPPTLAGSGDLGKIDEITVRIEGVTDVLPVYGFMPSGLDLNKFTTNQ